MSREIWSAIQRFALTDPEVLTTNSSVMVSKVRQESFVLIMDHISALDLFRMYDDVIIVNTDIRSVMLGVVLPKGSALAAPLSDVYVYYSNSIDSNCHHHHHYHHHHQPHNHHHRHYSYHHQYPITIVIITTTIISLSAPSSSLSSSSS